jgi:hypothetical protein
LAFGKTYEEAFRLGCNEIDLASLPDSSVPQFMIREAESGVGRQPRILTTPVAAPKRTSVAVDLESADTGASEMPCLYPVWFGTDRRPNDMNDLTKGFSAQRALDDLSVYFGVCNVAVPKSHKFGSVGSS